MKSQVLHITVWCNISGEAAGEIRSWEWQVNAPWNFLRSLPWRGSSREELGTIATSHSNTQTPTKVICMIILYYGDLWRLVRIAFGWSRSCGGDHMWQKWSADWCRRRNCRLCSYLQERRRKMLHWANISGNSPRHRLLRTRQLWGTVFEPEGIDTRISHNASGNVGQQVHWVELESGASNPIRRLIVANRRLVNSATEYVYTLVWIFKSHWIECVAAVMEPLRQSQES